MSRIEIFFWQERWQAIEAEEKWLAVAAIGCADEVRGPDWTLDAANLRARTSEEKEQRTNPMWNERGAGSTLSIAFCSIFSWRCSRTKVATAWSTEIGSFYSSLPPQWTWLEIGRTYCCRRMTLPLGRLLFVASLHHPRQMTRCEGPSELLVSIESRHFKEETEVCASP